MVDEHAAEVPTGTPGEIQVRGPNVMKGYWNLPDATANAIVDAGFRLATAVGSTRTETSSLSPARTPDNPRRPHVRRTALSRSANEAPDVVPYGNPSIRSLTADVTGSMRQ